MDKTIAPNYIRSNFRSSDRLAVMLIQKGTGERIQRIASAEQIASEPFQAWLRFKNKERHEVYISMSTLRPHATGRTKADVAEIRHVYLDLDKNGKQAVEALLSRDDLPTPSHILESSPGKYQIIWQVEQFEARQAEALMRGMVRELGADPAATDSTRVLRIPGFRNHKYDVPHIVTVETLGREAYRPNDFPAFENVLARDPLVADPGLIVKQTGRGDLSQSERDWAYAKRALARGEHPVQVALAIARHRLDKPNPTYYAERTVDRALRSLVEMRIPSETPDTHGR